MWSGMYDTVQPFMSQTARGRLDVVLTDTMVELGLPRFAHSVLSDLAVCLTPAVVEARAFSGELQAGGCCC